MKSILLVIRKHLETIVIFSILTMVTTALILVVTILKPSISGFRILIITLGSTMIGSVLIYLMTGYIRSHSHRKFTFPVVTEPIRALDKCKTTKPFSHETLDESCPIESNFNPSNATLIAINSE